jgi:hypothetical protein
MTRHLSNIIVLALFLAMGHAQAAQQVVVAMTPESIDEAIQLAADEKATVKFLDAYVVQTRAGWGHGPLIGSFSTPFARVVQAALAARKRGSSFATAEVTPMTGWLPRSSRWCLHGAGARIRLT